jgi:hypothetical protein
VLLKDQGDEEVDYVKEHEEFGEGMDECRSKGTK